MSAWPMLLTVVATVAVMPTLIIGVVLLVPDVTVNHLSVLDNPLQVVTDAWGQIASTTVAKLTVLKQQFLGQYSSEHAYVLFGFTVVMIIVSAALGQ